MKKLLKAGNAKIDKSCGVWSLPTSICKTQCPGCYAKKAEKLWPSVMLARMERYAASLAPDFVDRMIEECRKFKIVRIHESGDFYDRSYINRWADIVNACPDTQFYAFTKVREATALNIFGNCNIIFGLGLNYGDNAKVADLVRKGYHECPCKKGVKVACMKDCQVCLTATKVAFHKH